MAEAKKKEEGKQRQPSAKKRDLQAEKRKLRNKSYRASVLTSVRSLEKAIQEKADQAVVKAKLDAIYSVMDKGVKRGVFKPQKAARTKARMAARVAK
jgi:small subunit ribosomal protein S20